MSMFSNPLAFIKSQLMPVGTIIEWSPVEGGGVDLSTPAKVAAYYGFGTWEAYGQGRMLLGTDSSHAVGSTGGNSSISIDYSDGGFAEIGMVHSNYRYGVGFNSVGNDNGRWFSASWTRTFSDSVKYQSPAATEIEGTPLGGHSSPISILPPYITIYRWRRIA